MLLLGGCVHARTPVVEAAGDPSEASIAASPGTPTGVAAAQRSGPVAANATIVKVIDGDTVVLALGDREEHARLIGIDTPESKKPDTPVECFAKEASAALASLLPNGTAVRVERDVEERDRYGRLLVYVYRAADGLFVNFEMVRTGMAAALTISPNVTFADRFVDAAAAARTQRVGLWSACESGHEPLPSS